MAYGLFGWNALGGKKRAGRFTTAIILCIVLGLGVSSFSYIAVIEYGEWRKTYHSDGKIKKRGVWPISSGWIMFITMIYDLTFYSSKTFFVLLIILSKM